MKQFSFIINSRKNFINVFGLNSYTRWQLFLIATLLVAFFGLSVWIRFVVLDRPLSDHHEWITAHSLITIETWYKYGIQNYWFNPVLNYPNSHDYWYGCMQGSICDKSGNVYYVSYPPLGLWVPFIIFKVLFIYPSVLSLQIFNLVLHFVCAFILFLVIRLISTPKERWVLLLSAFTAYFAYLFSAETLWFHSNVYFIEIFAQLPFISAICIILYGVRHNRFYEKRFLFFTGLTIFLFCLTEWLGVLFAVSVAILCLMRIREYSKLLITTILSTSAALILTVSLYSQIHGFQTYFDTALKKYISRSGMAADLASDNSIRLSLDTVGFVKEHYTQGYGMQLTVLFILLLIALVIRKRIRTLFNRNELLFIYLSAVPVVLHHFLFFSFTVVHDFSVLKSAFLLAGLIGICLSILLSYIQENKLFAGISVITVLWVIYGSATQTYFSTNRVPTGAFNKFIGERIASTAQADSIIFLEGGFFDPRLIYYAKRNVHGATSIEDARSQMLLRHETQGQYYRGDGSMEVISLTF